MSTVPGTGHRDCGAGTLDAKDKDTDLPTGKTIPQDITDSGPNPLVDSLPIDGSHKDIGTGAIHGIMTDPKKASIHTDSPPVQGSTSSQHTALFNYCFTPSPPGRPQNK